MEAEILTIEELYEAGELTPIFSSVCAILSKTLPSCTELLISNKPSSMEMLFTQNRQDICSGILASEETLVGEIQRIRLDNSAQARKYYQILRDAVSSALTDHTQHYHLIV